MPVEDVLSRILDGAVWPVLPVLPAHIPEMLALPMHHRDPFDRLLIAQARAEGMALATADDQIRKYRSCRWRGKEWWRRGELNQFGLLKTRKLLISVFH